MVARGAKTPAAAEPAKTVPTGGRPFATEPDGRLAQLERDLGLLEAELDAQKKRLKDDDYRVPEDVVGQTLALDPRVELLLARRSRLQATLAEAQKRLAPDAPAIVTLQTELARVEQEITAAREFVRPGVVTALRAIMREQLVDRTEALEDQARVVRAARDARVLELARLRGDPAAGRPAGADDRLDQVLKELRELRDEVRRLKTAR